MKKLLTILGTILLASTIYAQVPEKMSYQAAIRNSSNQLVANQQVGTRVSILQGTPTGVVVYVETQTPSTNANGLVSIEIGAGAVVDGNFTSIDWESGPYFIKTETDPKGGTNYTITGTSQLLSVPYALHAKTAEIVTETVAETDPTYSATFSIANPQQGDLLSYNATTNKWEQYTPDYATGNHVHNLVTDKTNGFMSAADKAKLDGLKSGNILSIGQEHLGGIIFWLDATGQYHSITVDGATYGGWYLPSKYELNLLYQQKNLVGGFIGDYYWSSTEVSKNRVISQRFADGNQAEGVKDPFVNDRVRPIRAF